MTCRQGILPLVVVFPQPLPARQRGDVDWLRGLIQEAGIPMIDTFSIFREMGRERFNVRPKDLHPGREAHQEIADRIYAWLVRNDDLLGAGLEE